ncbi:MAG TPA: class I SAM-dependent methyltransferase [Anaerolineaceae bacterium]|nr:class I SAM-dependent methyltransferase [Anaerolineaceae bacterium]HPN53492.1 class I SAM-dependent methyltransferase [Anaerolineaceae bacterium]
MERKEIAALVSDVIAGYVRDPLDILQVNSTADVDLYLQQLAPTYVRTLEDILAFRPAPARVLEVGAFLGVVSLCLARLGYTVEATDIPEFMAHSGLRARFEKAGIRCQGLNLRHTPLPYADGSFDIIICCEVIEHLNFNPLPMLQEFNRMGSLGSLFYLSHPNIASWKNRLKMARGRSIHNPVNDFFIQLEPGYQMIVGLHWREYDGAEMREMLERMGYRVERQVYFSDVDLQVSKRRWLSKLAKKLLLTFLPGWKENITHFAVKEKTVQRAFHFTDATRTDIG